MKTPDKDLEKEIMEWVFSAKGVDHNRALSVWKENPWKAVSMYEAARFPEMLDLPLVQPQDGTVKDEVMSLERDIDAFFGKVHMEEGPRASAGEYDFGAAKMAIVNRFGRVTNPEDIYDDRDF